MKQLIKGLKEKDQVQSFFVVREKNVSTDRNGKAVMSLSLGDVSGEINSRMFEKVSDFSNGFAVADVVYVKGFVQLFQNRRQLIIHEIRRANQDEYSTEEVVKDLSGDVEAHFAALMAVVQGLKNTFVRDLLVKTLADSEVGLRLKKAPAAKSIHHAYRGGLIEHIHSIVRVMESLAAQYGFLNRDLLIFGAIYHDLGKIFELSGEDGIQYTRSGRLVGHMVLATDMIERFASEIEGFPDGLKDVLKHLVLAHHGKLEYGSPKLPMLPEAMVVAMIDDLDSKLNTLFHFLKSEVESIAPTESWSHFHPGFERYFYLDFFRQQL